MAGLERTDELQPDEQYKIGLPHMARFDKVTTYMLPKPRATPPPVYRINSPPSPPPPPPPKSNYKPRDGATLPPDPTMPKDTGTVQHIGTDSGTILSVLDGIEIIPNRHPALLTPSSRGWVETNLDESSSKSKSLNCTMETSQGQK
jgi:hypothetical protein